MASPADLTVPIYSQISRQLPLPNWLLYFTATLSVWLTC